jgi:uncharacterized protein (DUF362 family)
MSVSRRLFFARAGALAAAQGLVLKAQQTPPAQSSGSPAPGRGGSGPTYGKIDPRAGTHDIAKQYNYSDRRAKVALIKGDDRRKNVYEALVAIDDQIRPALRAKKYVLIKPNGPDPRRDGDLGWSKGDAMHGILDYLAARFKGPVVVAEQGSVPAMQAVSEYGWNGIFAEHKPLDIKLEFPNEEGQYGLMYGIDYDMHPIPIRLVARFLDPAAFVISSSVMKTHNVVVATLSIKNVVMGSPLRPPPGSNRVYAESETRKFHVGIRASNLNMYLAFQRMLPNWGVGLIDGFEGMEGNGPASGTPVPHRIALASTDFLAADRVGVECMGIDAGWLGYLNYAYQGGLGQYDLAKIDVVGTKIAEVQRKYRLHADFDRMLDWQGPMKDLPQTL